MASRLFVGAVSDILFEINVTSNLGSSVHRSICRTARGSSSGSCQRPGYPSVGPRSFLNRNMPVFRNVGLPQILLRWCQPTRSRNRIIRIAATVLTVEGTYYALKIFVLDSPQRP